MSAFSESRAPWERVKVSVPEEVVTYHVANELGGELRLKGQVEEAKVFLLAALEGRRKVLGEENRKTLMSLNTLGIVLRKMKDNEGALSYY